MTKRMLIDATHAEETRVVVLDGNRLEDFDVETSTKRQLKGNIYLAKVVRVEPSLQAAFVEYGGNRHGFLAFSEIHPDYYQIPVADRQRLLEMQAEDARREEEEEDLELALNHAIETPEPAQALAPARLTVDDSTAKNPTPEGPAPEAWAFPATPHLTVPASIPATAAVSPETANPQLAVSSAENWSRPDQPPLLAGATADEPAQHDEPVTAKSAQALTVDVQRIVEHEGDLDDSETYEAGGETIEALPPPETVGGDHDNADDQRERRMPPRFLRNYKIQEVIRRRQIMLIQVVKEERGTKGAALTTYLSLAGRFGVLMPNSPRGGGISRKITSATDRRRLKEVMSELDIPRGMGMIVRTAGANRPKPEIKRDCEYLLRLWDDIRDQTMRSVAPALIYEEASLIKRAIRDVYSRDIDEILVDGEDGWRAAHDFMRMLMPTHAKKVQLWRDNGAHGGQPLFARNQVEAQLDGMLMPTVQLRSGGYLVINQAEALVAIDVNSGRSTRERNIEETALRTNLEAADEVARQLRLRDLAGLIVIDFIDMESKRHNAMVERRIKEALKNDRARIQIGHISHFGLLEMSRQRLRPSLAETSFIPCPHCAGTGHVRSTENAAIHVLRGIEDEGSKRRAAEVIVHVSTPVALYLLNHKRERLHEIELRYVMRVIIGADDAQIAPQFRIERVRARSPDEVLPVVMAERPMPLPIQDVEDEEQEVEAGAVETETAAAERAENEDDDDIVEPRSADATAADATGAGADAVGSDDDEAERRRKKRRRRRRGKRDDLPSSATDEPEAETGDERNPAVPAVAAAASAEPDVSEAAVTDVPAEAVAEAAAEAGQEAGDPAAADDDPRNRRRGRRGGRRRRREPEAGLSPFAVPGADQPELLPVYAGPTPADPFGGRAFDIFDVMDQAERAAEAKPALRAEIVSNTEPELELELVDEMEAAPPVTLHNGQAAHQAAETAGSVAVEPAAEALAVVAGPSAPASEIVAEIVSPEPQPVEPQPAEPLIKPIMVGAGGEVPAEKKRGWWRR